MTHDDDGLSPEDERMVDEAVARMRAEHARAERLTATQAEAVGYLRRAHEAERERERWRSAAIEASRHEGELAERLSLANAALARVLALADRWDAQALEQAAYGQNAQAAILAVDAQALRQAVNGDQPDDEVHSDYAPPGASS